MTVKVEYWFHSDGTVGSKFWRNEEGRAHREDGPAYEYSIGRKFWYKNGLSHREDGPAIIWENGVHEYYLSDVSFLKKDYWEKIEEIKKERIKKGKEEK